MSGSPRFSPNCFSTISPCAKAPSSFSSATSTGSAALLEGTSGADNLIFVTQLSILGWWIGYLAIWSLFRHQRLLSAVIPGGVALLVNAYYSSASMTGYLILYAAAVLLLAIRVELARNETRWQMTRVRYAPDITLDFLKAGVAFTALVLILAWAMPDVTQNLTVERVLRPFEGPWQKVEDTWNRMYKSLNYGSSAAAVSTLRQVHELRRAPSA